MIFIWERKNVIRLKIYLYDFSFILGVSTKCCSSVCLREVSNSLIVAMYFIFLYREHYISSSASYLPNMVSKLMVTPVCIDLKRHYILHFSQAEIIVNMRLCSLSNNLCTEIVTRVRKSNVFQYRQKWRENLSLNDDAIHVTDIFTWNIYLSCV